MSKHEEILVVGIRELERKGFRVIRLDHRIIPDAIAISKDKVIAVESSTSDINVYLVKQKFSKGSQYDEAIIITQRAFRSHTTEEKDWVSKEYQRGKTSMRKLQLMFQKKFGRTVSLGTIHKWVKGIR